MRTLAQFIAGVVFAAIAGASSAHPNHGDGPPIGKEQVPALGDRAVMLLVEAKQLPQSWRGRPVKEVSSRETPVGPVWVVSYENPGEPDRAKRTVYLFFDEFGNFIGGNHSGKLQ